MQARAITLVAFLFAPLPVPAQTASGSLIQGQILDTRAAAPVRFAAVRLLRPGPDASTPVRQVKSDEQGRFTFRDVAPGVYLVEAQREGYVPATGSRLRVRAGEPIPPLDIRMTPCGVIAGKVLDENGAPAANVEMVALRYSYGAWEWRPPVTPDTPLKAYSNDIGEFRLANLAPGTYIVRATAAPRIARNRLPESSYPTLFYPAALSPEGAEPVTVAPGAEALASLTLRPGPAFRISGTITGYTPGKNVCFGLAPRSYYASTTQVIGRTTRFGADGVFVINGVPPGAYTFSASGCMDEPALGAIVPVEVAGDVDGLHVELTAGPPLSGVVKAEGIDLSNLTLNLRSPDVLAGFPVAAPVGAGGAFTFEHVLKRHYVVEFSSLPVGAYVQSVKYNGREVPAAGFEPQGDAALEISLSRVGAAQLSGAVVTRSGQPAARATVLALPADDGPAESAAATVAGPDGRFLFPALRPGAYRVMAFERRYLPLEVLSADPALPGLIQSEVRTVTVAPGGPAAVSLTWSTEAEVDRARAASRMTPPR